MPNVDLETVIEDAVTDSQLPPEPAEDVVVDTPAEPVADEPAVEPTDQVAVTDKTPEEKPEGDEPLTKDEFELKFGIPPAGSSGRENRIPYTRKKNNREGCWRGR